MNITGTNNYANNLNEINFKGENKKQSPVSEPSNEEKSKQNNSPEIFIPKEVYIGAYVNKFLNKMEKEGKIEFAKEDENNILQNENETTEAIQEEAFGKYSDMGELSGVEDDYYDLYNEDDDDLIQLEAEMASDSTISTLQIVADELDDVPENLKGKIPTIIKFDGDDFINTIKKNTEGYEEGMENYLEIEGKIDELEDFTEEEKESAKKLLKFSKEYIESGAMDNAMEVQKLTVEILKNEKKEELNEAVDNLSKKLNYALYKALDAGFKNDPNTVINCLSTDIPVYTEPKIKDNNDGTSTLTYYGMRSIVEIKRNNKNGDYISAVGKKDGRNLFDVNFRENGSIENLEYLNTLNETQISITTNSENDKIKVQQSMPEGIAERVFEKNNEGLKQISFKMYLK